MNQIGGRPFSPYPASSTHPSPAPLTEIPPRTIEKTRRAKTARTYRVPWVDLLKKVSAIDVLACPECTGRMQVIAFIAQATVAKRILDHLGLDSTGPPVARAAPPPEQVDLGPSCDASDAPDPVHPE